MDDDLHGVTVSRKEYLSLRDAVKRIATLTRDNERLENLLAQGVHTCSNQCKRPMCVLRRENRGLREAAQAVVDAEMARRNDAETNTLVWILNHRDLIDELAKALEQGD